MLQWYTYCIHILFINHYYYGKYLSVRDLKYQDPNAYTTGINSCLYHGQCNSSNIMAHTCGYHLDMLFYLSHSRCYR